MDRHLARLIACLSMIASSAFAHDGSTIQKCVRPDGSILYQQDVCPPGSKSNIFSGNDATSETMVLAANSNHQYSTNMTINGVTVTGYVDTGATFVTLSVDTAIRMNVYKNNTSSGMVQTANGVIAASRVRIPVMKVGKFTLYNVDAVVLPNTPSLIGMNALNQLKMSTENGALILVKP